MKTFINVVYVYNKIEYINCSSSIESELFIFNSKVIAYFRKSCICQSLIDCALDSKVCIAADYYQVGISLTKFWAAGKMELCNRSWVAVKRPSSLGECTWRVHLAPEPRTLGEFSCTVLLARLCCP